MKNIFSTITIYSIGHFLIDFISAFVIASIIISGQSSIVSIAILVVLYNIIAFGTQPFFGYLADVYGKAHYWAIYGLLISTIGAFFYFEPIIAVILLGIGNAIYHIGGGIIALNLEPSKAKYPGIYVAPGAIGLFIGGILGYLRVNYLVVILLIVLASLILILLIKFLPLIKIQKFKERKVDLISIVLILLLISVCMRSLVGYSLVLGWKSIFIFGLLLALTTALGKFFGGFLADKFGFMKVSIIGLLIAAPLLTFFQSIPLLVFIGIFCFNLTMPITLVAIAEAIPNYKGLAFGLTTLALVLGYVLFIIFKPYIVLGYLFTFITIFINVVSIYFGLRKYEEMKA